MVALAHPKKKDRENSNKGQAADSKEWEQEWSSVRLAAASRRRWRWGLLAGALIAAGAVAGAGAGTWADETSTVAVLATDLPAGHVVTADDLRSVDLNEPDGVSLIAPEAAEGMVLTQPVPEGAPLVAGSLADSALWPEQGQAVVAVPVTTVPSGIEEGTTVDLIPTAASSGEDAQAESAVTGLVHQVGQYEDDFGTGQQVVEVVLPRDQAVKLSRSVPGGEEAALTVVHPSDGSLAAEEEEDAQ